LSVGICSLGIKPSNLLQNLTNLVITNKKQTVLP